MGSSNQDPTAYSQERQQDDTLSSSTRKLVRSGDDSQIERTWLEFHNMQISDHRYFDKVFKDLRL